MGDLGKLIVAKGFKKLPKVQKIAQSGHTGQMEHLNTYLLNGRADDYPIPLLGQDNFSGRRRPFSCNIRQ